MPNPSPDAATIIENLLRLRRTEESADLRLQAELAPVRELLEDLVGPTVRAADAARLLRVSRPAIKRWLDRGQIASVVTPEGRREIPLSELVDLIEELEEKGDENVGRPLTRVIRDRERRAAESVDLKRLVPSRRRRTHRAPELQALAYHRLVAERLDERMVNDASRRLQRWCREGRIDPRWAEQWERVLAKSLPEIRKAISADTTPSRELRQTSPFAGALTEQERRRLVKAVEDRLSA